MFYGKYILEFIALLGYDYREDVPFYWLHTSEIFDLDSGAATILF